MYELRQVAKSIFLKIGTDHADRIWSGEADDLWRHPVRISSIRAACGPSSSAATSRPRAFWSARSRRKRAREAVLTVPETISRFSRQWTTRRRDRRDRQGRAEDGWDRWPRRRRRCPRVEATRVEALYRLLSAATADYRSLYRVWSRNAITTTRSGICWCTADLSEPVIQDALQELSARHPAVRRARRVAPSNGQRSEQSDHRRDAGSRNRERL